MALTTGERSLHKVTVASEMTHGTRVDPTAYLNMESNGIIDLDRAYAAPQEDYGKFSDTQPNRGTYGVRLARMPLRGVVRFEDLQEFLAPSLAGGVTPATVSTGVYSWVYAADDTSDTLTSKTVQEGDNIQAYEMTYGLIDRLRLSYNALAAPGNSPWMLEADFIGQDKKATSFSGTPATVNNAETAMGHLTTCAIGATGTSYAGLSNTVGLLAFDVTVQVGVIPRVYGAASNDAFQVHGRGIRSAVWTAMFLEMAGTKSALWDIFQVAGPQPTDQRMRVACTGTAIAGGFNKQMYIDGRIEFTAVPVAEQNGGTVYNATGRYIDDSTLSSNIEVTVQNGIATLV